MSLVIAMLLLRWVFRRDSALATRRRSTRQDSRRRSLNSIRGRSSRTAGFLARSAIILGLTVLGFALAQPLGLGMDFIAMAGGTAALLFAGRGVEDTIAKVNWTVILFFTGLFLVIGCVESTGVLEKLAAAVVSTGRRQPGQADSDGLRLLGRHECDR